MSVLYAIFADPFVQMASAPDLLVQALWEGLVSGVLYALIALGFVLIFKASGVFNFAQGIMVVFAALTLVGLHEKGVPAWLALALTIGVMLILAMAVERLVLRPLVNQTDIILFMATFGLTYVLIGLGELIFGGNPKQMIARELGLPRGAITWNAFGGRVDFCEVPDWIYNQGWGAMNPTAVKEAIKTGFPIGKLVGVWWAGGDDDARAGGAEAKGYKALNFHASGDGFPVIQDIRKHVVDKGLSKHPKEKVGENLYNRGVYNLMLIAEAIRTAQKITGKKVVTGEDVRRGFEGLNITEARLKEMGMEGFAAPVKVSCTDHNGHHKVYVAEWHGTKWIKGSDWMDPMKDKVRLLLEAAAAEYAKSNTGIVAILGANGAGKTTTLKAISNLLHSERGEVTKGSIVFEGARIDRLSPNELVKRGCIQVMEGRHCFGHLTIEENPLTGALTRRDGRAAIKADLEMIYTLFPRLKDRRSAMAGDTSGGEQQMCAVGRAMMSRPKMILLDEPSMGLAPQVVEEIFEIVKRLNADNGVSFLIAEQNTNMALRYATDGYIMETGRIVMDGEAASLRENDDVKEFYLGVAGADRKSFRDVKSYKRRKRWLA